MANTEDLGKSHEDKASTMTENQEETPTAMSSSSRLTDRDWDDVLAEIEFHKEHHPKEDVPLDYLEWVQVQRALFQENKLEEDKLEKLGNLGFRWDEEEDEDDKFFEQLENYQQLRHEDNADEEEAEAENEHELAEWFDNQVFLFHAGELPTEHLQKFEELGFQLANCTPAPEPEQPQEDYDDSELITANLRTASSDAFQSLQEEQSAEPLDNDPTTTETDTKSETQFDSPGRNTRSAKKRATKASTHKNGHASSSSTSTSTGSTRKRGRSAARKASPKRKPSASKSPAKSSKQQQQTHRAWEESFEALKRYKQQNGNCNIPRGYAQDSALASWVKSQRKKRHSMSNDKRQKLDELGFLWEPMTFKWNRNFQLLQDYRNKVADSSMSPEQFARLLGPKTNIGSWFRFQQEQVKTHGKLTSEQQIKFLSFLEGLSKGTPITNKRIADAMDMTPPNENDNNYNDGTAQEEMRNPPKRVKLARNTLVSPDKRNESKRSWDGSLAALVAFKHAHGHTNVPQNYAKDTALGHWVKTQRKTRASLSVERQQMLTQLGFNWEPRNSQWMAHFEEVVELGEGLDTSNMDAIEYSKCLCKSVGKWFRSQLVKLSSGQLNYEQQSKLIPFLSQFKDDKTVLPQPDLAPAAAPKTGPSALTIPKKKNHNWAPTCQRSWEENLEALKQFKEEHGHTAVPQIHQDDPILGQWVKTQRKQRQTMDREKKQSLDALGFVWNPKLKKWNDNFQAIREKRKAMRGCSTTPERFARLLGRHTSLGWWFKYQLELMKNGKLNDDQEAKLKFFLSNLSVGTRTVGLGAECLNFERGVPLAPEEKDFDDDYDDDDDIYDEEKTEHHQAQPDTTMPALGEDHQIEANIKATAAASKQPVDVEMAGDENDFMATLEGDEELRKLHECEAV